jgi:hypothetical protein
MSGHTPGPWRVEEGTTLIWGKCNPDDQSTFGMGYPITLCQITPSGSWAKGPDADEGKANAHLIAAAPDLLDQLDFARSLLVLQMRVLGEDVEASPLIAEMDAALAKARGQS